MKLLKSEKHRALEYILLRYGAQTLLNLLAILILSTTALAADLSSQIKNAEFGPFDLYLGGKLQGTVALYYSEKEFLIENPKDLVEQLNITLQKEELEKFLTGIIENTKKQAGLATVEIDRDTFRLIVSLDPSLLSNKELSLESRLDSALDKFSFQHIFGGTYAQSLDEPEAYAINNQSLFSYGATRARFDHTLLQKGEYEIPEAYLASNISEYELSAGYLLTPGMTFAQSAEFLGFGWRTAEEIFLDQESLTGSELQIFVPSRSRVKFFKDGRLLGVQVLDFGLQSVDTSSFPQGSYYVDIEIIGNDGIVERETRFFSKSSLLGIRTRPIFNFQIGYRRNDFEVETAPIYNFSAQWRALSFLQIKGQAFGDETFSIGSAEVLGLYDTTILGIEIERSTSADLGLSSRFETSLFDIRFSSNLIKTLKGFDDPERTEKPEEDEENIVEDFLGIQDGADGLLSSKRTDVNSQIGYTIDNIDLKLIYNSSKSLDVDERKALGPRLDWRVFDDGDNRVTFQVGALDTQEGRQIISYLSYSFTQGAWNTNTRLDINDSDLRNQQSLSQTTTYDKKTISGNGSRYRLANILTNPNGTENGEIADNMFELDQVGTWYGVNGFAKDLRAEKEDSTSFGLNAKSSFVLSQDKHFTIAPPSSAEAIFIAEIESQSTSTPVEIFINGQLMEKTTVGSSVVIPLSPFKKYIAEVRPADGSDLIRADNGSYEFVLFPGNIVRQKWRIDKVSLVLGKVLDASGNPLKYKRLKGSKEFIFTEEDGSFQAELMGSEKLSVDLPEGLCSINIQEEKISGDIVDLGEVACLP